MSGSVNAAVLFRGQFKERCLPFAIACFYLSLPAYAAKPFPPAPPSYVYNENVISPAAESRLSASLRAFEDETGHQFVVALFQSLDGEAVEDYTNRLFKAWRIGSKKENDGLLLCVFLKEHRWRIEVGYGLEPILTDLEAAEILQQAAVPYFKAGNYDDGVENAAQTLIAKLRGNDTRSELQNAASRDEEIMRIRIAQFYAALKLIAWLILGFFFIFWYTFEHGIDWGFRSSATYKLVEHDGRNLALDRRYPIRFLVILFLYFLLLAKIVFEFARLLMYGMLFNRGGYYGGGSWSGGGWGGGGFSGGGGSSGGGGASGSW